jgi:NAD-dependent dihydropyrimidine dehydrogenase PreA subunit
MERASCSACRDACPRDAWVIDDDLLGIDATRCDACELCVPVCPQGAIARRFSPALKHTDTGGVAFAACEHSRVGNARDGLMPCLHALGIRELLRLRREGATFLVTCHGDCESCPRGGGEGFTRRLDETNRILESRNLDTLKCRDMKPAAWTKALRHVEGMASRRVLDRRTFFRNAVKAPRERVEAVLDDVEDVFLPPGMLLGDDAGYGHHPYVPSIDPATCSGCDACVRLCPQEAIRLEVEEAQAAYLIDAKRCSNCSLCVDICEQDAVRVDRNCDVTADRVELHRERCRVCGIEFHLPGARGCGATLCWVCAKTNHHRNLFQVLD